MGAEDGGAARCRLGAGVSNACKLGKGSGGGGAGTTGRLSAGAACTVELDTGLDGGNWDNKSAILSQDEGVIAGGVGWAGAAGPSVSADVGGCSAAIGTAPASSGRLCLCSDRAPAAISGTPGSSGKGLGMGGSRPGGVVRSAATSIASGIAGVSAVTSGVREDGDRSGVYTLKSCTTVGKVSDRCTAGSADRKGCSSPDSTAPVAAERGASVGCVVAVEGASTAGRVAGVAGKSDLAGGAGGGVVGAC
jgi:hypothetical protein